MHVDALLEGAKFSI